MAAKAEGTGCLGPVQAEAMTLPAGAGVVIDRSASGGHAVRLTRPGTSLTGTVSLPSGATSVTVVAEGTRCQHAQASADNVGYVYVTDDTLPNPYDTLPSNLSAETSAARAGR
jgi:hypothetical protein